MFDVLINYLRYPANHRFGFLVRRPRVFHKDRYHIAVPTGKQYEANIIYADVLPALVPVAGSGLVPQHCLRSLQRIRQPGRSAVCPCLSGLSQQSKSCGTKMPSLSLIYGKGSPQL